MHPVGTALLHPDEEALQILVSFFVDSFIRKSVVGL